MFTGLHLLLIAGADRIIGMDYIGIDLVWRSSLLCHSLGLVSIVAILLSAFFLLLLCLSRYLAVRFPMKHIITKSLVKQILLLLTCIVIILVSVTLFIRSKIEKLQYMSSPLCILLGNLGDSLTQRSFTLCTSFILIAIMLTILMLYGGLFAAQKTSSLKVDNLSMHTNTSRKTVTFYIIAVGLTNILCWLPSSGFYLVSSFLDKFPVVLLYWIILVVMPINPLINPILFNFKYLKSTLQMFRFRPKFM